VSPELPEALKKKHLRLRNINGSLRSEAISGGSIATQAKGLLTTSRKISIKKRRKWEICPF